MQAEQVNTARASYEADGFYLYQQPLIPADVVQGAVDGMDALRRGEYATGQKPQPSFWNPGDPADKLVKIEMSQTCDPRIMALITYPALGKLAADYLRTEVRASEVGPLTRYLLQRAARDGPTREADWASYLLFDGGFARDLIELGRADAQAKADQIRQFFAD